MKKTTFILSLIFTFYTQACDQGFLPDNNFFIPLNSIFSNDITEQEFKETVQQFEKFFNEPIDRDLRAELILYSSWESPTVNAYADQRPKKYLITIYGGLARHKAITIDGLKAVLCHELGHHFGGYPKKSVNKWSSAEGQSDYYATMKCLRRLWENEDNERALANKEIPLKVQNECALTYPSIKEKHLCHRMSLAGLSVALMIQDLDSDSITPRFETPDSYRARTLNYQHPYAQCRLDTFFQGAICPVNESFELDDQDEKIGACHSKNGDLRGNRPPCWFVESY